jgi:hypothetical protein
VLAHQALDLFVVHGHALLAQGGPDTPPAILLEFVADGVSIRRAPRDSSSASCCPVA